MRNRSKATLRNQRGTTILSKAETKRVRKFLPNG
jgi:ribosomal protein L35